ncbi:ABC transporter permease [Virgibacillus oceani]
MKNKNVAYANLSIKTLIGNKSILFGFIFNLIVALIAVTYLLIFQPDLPTLHMSSDSSYDFRNALGMLNIIVIIVVLFLFGSVAVIMQSVIDDRDSKVSEIISTSISEKNYLFGKLVTSIALTLVTIMSALASVIIAGIAFSIFNPYDFGIYADIIKPLLSAVDFETMMFLIGSLGICILMLVTSTLFALGISIKASNAVDAFPVSMLVLTPYFLVFGLLIFLPTDNSELWISISTMVSFVPVFSPIFILMNVLLNGFSILSYLAIIVSIIYLVLMFKAVANIYSYAFYVHEKLSVKRLFKLSVTNSA